MIKWALADKTYLNKIWQIENFARNEDQNCARNQTLFFSFKNEKKILY